MAEFEEWLAQIVERTASPRLRDLASKGLVPFPPAQMIQALAILAGDETADVRRQAMHTLGSLPRALLLGAAADPGMGVEEIRHLARALHQDEELLSRLAANPSLPEDVVILLAESAHPGVLETLARNQERLRGNHDAFSRLLANPALPARLRGYLAEVRERQRAAQKVVLEEDVAEEPVGEPVFDEVLTKDHEEDDEKLSVARRQEVQEKRRHNIFQMIRAMTVPEKIILALRGNRDARQLLIRDTNKMVCTKVLESPRLSEIEVEMFAKMTNVSDDVLRGIAQKKEWIGKYNIMRALAANARTPLGIGLPLVSRLTVRDLTNLGRNRNVQETIRQTAAKLAKMRREQRTGGG